MTEAWVLAADFLLRLQELRLRPFARASIAGEGLPVLLLREMLLLCILWLLLMLLLLLLILPLPMLRLLLLLLWDDRVI